uniref:Uncharacterized protein n=1 Tax=Anguilla anguilla TaxID=7936 RepID=A0A0E9S3U2_ANGAN
MISLLYDHVTKFCFKARFRPYVLKKGVKLPSCIRICSEMYRENSSFNLTLLLCF